MAYSMIYSSSDLHMLETNDITDCFICRKTLRNPKSLPCLHTFCLGCLEQKFAKSTPGCDNSHREGHCPFCRKCFQVPPSGLAQLPTNTFIGQLIEAGESTVGGSVRICQICSSSHGMEASEDAETTEPSATMYCMDCREYMCSQCSEIHRNMKMTKSHDIVETESVGNLKLGRGLNNFCDKHSDREKDIYCKTCNKFCCFLCFSESHQFHGFENTPQAVEKLITKIKKNVELLKKTKTGICVSSQILESQKNEFSKSVEEVKLEAAQKCEEIKRLADKHYEEVLADMEVKFRNEIKKCDTIKETLRRESEVLENFMQYSQAVMESGNSTDILGWSADLEGRATELNKEKTVADFGVAVFKPTKLQKLGFSHQWNVVGKIEIPQPIPISYETRMNKIISFHNYVQGVAVCGVTMFVGFSRSNEIKLFHASTLEYQRNIVVYGLTDPWDLAAVNNDLFVSECDSKLVHRVQLSDESTTSWNVDSSNPGLSITKKDNLLVSCGESRRLIFVEYTPAGELVRELKIRSSVGFPMHAIELHDGRLCACVCGVGVHCVCVFERWRNVKGSEEESNDWISNRDTWSSPESTTISTTSLCGPVPSASCFLPKQNGLITGAGATIVSNTNLDCSTWTIKPWSPSTAQRNACALTQFGGTSLTTGTSGDPTTSATFTPNEQLVHATTKPSPSVFLGSCFKQEIGNMTTQQGNVQANVKPLSALSDFTTGTVKSTTSFLSSDSAISSQFSIPTASFSFTTTTTTARPSYAIESATCELSQLSTFFNSSNKLGTQSNHFHSSALNIKKSKFNKNKSPDDPKGKTNLAKNKIIFGGKRGSNPDELNTPSHLACSKDGYIMVADTNNNRVLLLSPAMELVREMIPASAGLKSSFKICLDEYRQRFIVADTLNKRLIVYDLM